MIYCVFFFSGRIRHTICALVTGVHTCALPISGLLGGLEKYDSKLIRKRSSSPKFQVHNTALISAQRHEQFSEIRQRPDEWGERKSVVEGKSESVRVDLGGRRISKKKNSS